MNRGSPEVVKRDGSKEPVRFDAILSRVTELKGELKVDAVKVTQTVVQGVRDGITTKELDELTVDTAASLAALHPDYSFLAARVAVSNLHKSTNGSILAVAEFMSEEVREFATRHVKRIDAAFDFDRDYAFDIFGFKTLERSYLLRDRVSGQIVERPQVLYMRNALGIHLGDIEGALDTYERTSKGLFTHATPTMFNAGMCVPSMASCFLLPVKDDSIRGIFDTLGQCAQISKSAGGIGLSFTNVRASGSPIASTGGKSAGLLPLLRIFDATARAVDQGGGKRKGAIAVYLEPWHLDVEMFLELKKPHGTDELRARDLFYALWIPDLFMERVEAGGSWTLFCPSVCPDLVDLSGDAFRARYCECEADPSLPKKTLKARDLWTSILVSQLETGTPFMLFKDAANGKSNHRHLGTIRCSNLCTEIIQYSSNEEIAVCNLGSVALPKFVMHTQEGATFDHEALRENVHVLTRNLNLVIDRNHYPIAEAKASNSKHRPIGIGVQGLADAFMLMRFPYDSPDAKVLNIEIFETLYFAALEASCALAEKHGPYDSYEGSPAASGMLQFDLWREYHGGRLGGDEVFSGRWDWDGLKARIQKSGLRNSLLIAPMPTASTAQILGNTECFEPPTSNVYVRRVQAGEFALFNRRLVAELERLGLWGEEVRMEIIAAGGSVQGIECIPEETKKLFKTAWELSQRVLIDLAADRGVFVDQSQSLNLFLPEPSHAKLSSMHFHAWKSGLKTGMYYLRSKPAANAIQVTVPVELSQGRSEGHSVTPVCSADPGACESCSA